MAACEILESPEAKVFRVLILEALKKGLAQPCQYLQAQEDLVTTYSWAYSPTYI